MPSTYQRWVEEYGIEGAKEKMREIGRAGGKAGGGKAGFHTMPKAKRKKISRMGVKARAQKQAV